MYHRTSSQKKGPGQGAGTPAKQGQASRAGTGREGAGTVVGLGERALGRGEGGTQ